MAGPAKLGSDPPVADGTHDIENDAGARPAALDRIIQAQIGDKLRAMYGELIEQPVPDKLAALLDRLSPSKR